MTATRSPRARRPRPVLAALAALAVALGTLAAGLAPAAPARADEPAGAMPTAIGPLVWADEFNGPAGQSPDPSRWQMETGGHGWGNNESQYYTNRPSNASLDGSGNLVITARRENPGDYQCHYGRCEYTSARLNTSGRFTQAYGRFEARMRLPRGQGIWPAFWMLGDNFGQVGWPASGELDIMENIGREPSTVHGTLHGPGYSGGSGVTGSYTLPGGRVFADGFHTFTVDWTPTSISWYVDGTLFQTRTAADLRGNPWVFDHPFFMILNVAVGGNWPGYPDGSTQFPQSLTVDYVRVYSWVNDGGTGGGAITGLGGRCLDVAGANTANGTTVQMYDCNGTNAQRWTRPGDGTVRALGKCLDISGGATNDGARVQLWDCNGTAAQQWVYTAARDLVNPAADRCLDVTNGTAANAIPVQLWTCNGTAAQKWTVT
ncbi:glycoside hydrolase family 16 protein [Allonocardiopsis opalescens]|uniref:Beta-glucanase (GH16 family) n=1 Tax=Allonocardiopsis opalescens TaxID=1144618 RepID=A0A2T0Q9G0_9ACTN|nr:glycoside hydrolase family 16 protein [Allonocardiopsis opalescens]PRY00494.1 beta-glucanase (GH16 family) [Allonocardiopsis opalescens]